MNEEMKKHLEAVVVAIANEQTADAKAEFSKYLRLKTQSILVGEAEEADDDDDDDESDDKDDKDDKDNKKAPPFVKKDKDDKKDKKDKE